VNSGVLKALRKYIPLKRHYGFIIMLGLVLLILFSVFNKPMLENLENSVNHKVELTLLVDSSNVIMQNSAQVKEIWSNVTMKYKSEPRVIIVEQDCMKLDNFLQTCKGGTYSYTNMLKSLVETWQKDCPWIGISTLDTTLGETIETGALRSLVKIVKLPKENNSVAMEEVIKTIDTNVKTNIVPPTTSNPAVETTPAAATPAAATPAAATPAAATPAAATQGTSSRNNWIPSTTTTTTSMTPI